MSGKYLGLFRNESLRLPTHDYGTSCSYFVTIDTFAMNEYFGEVIPARTGHDPSIQYSEIGMIARDYWIEIPKHYSFAELDSFIIMPNHLHGILNLILPKKDNFEMNKFGPQRKNLATVIGSYKAAVKRYANKNGIDFGWKSRYHEGIIWRPEQLNKIRNYIQTNPQQLFLGKSKKA
jgi:putative transposase